MKKYLFLLTLFCSSASMAFPAYNIVGCSGNINGHSTYIEYNRLTRLFVLNVDGSRGAAYANEAENRIYTNAEYDKYGNSLFIELLSNSSNWQATFNIYSNRQLALSEPINCQRTGVARLGAEQTQKSATALLSKLQVAK